MNLTTEQESLFTHKHNFQFGLGLWWQVVLCVLITGYLTVLQNSKLDWKRARCIFVAVKCFCMEIVLNLCFVDWVCGLCLTGGFFCCWVTANAEMPSVLCVTLGCKWSTLKFGGVYCISGLNVILLWLPGPSCWEVIFILIRHKSQSIAHLLQRDRYKLSEWEREREWQGVIWGDLKRFRSLEIQ